MSEEKEEKKRDRNSKGQFTKGHKKTGGRQMGTKNRNGNVRDRLKELIEPFIDELDLNLAAVKKEEGTAAMLALMEKFMPYFMPKYSALSIGADQDRPLSEEEHLNELEKQYTKKMLSINIKSLTVVNNDKRALGDEDPDDDPDFDLSKLMAEAE